MTIMTLLTDALSDGDHCRGLLDDLLELLHDLCVRHVDLAPRYYYAAQLDVNYTSFTLQSVRIT